MDIPELETLARVAIQGAPKDLQLAKSKFVRLAARDPQAIFVMADDATRTAIAEGWFASFAKRSSSPKGGASASDLLPERAPAGKPTPTIAPLASQIVPIEGHGNIAGGAPPSETDGHRTSANPANARPPSVSDRKPRANGPPVNVRLDQPLLAAPARPQSITDIRAARVVAQEMVRTVFDSFKVRDGRAIGDVLWSDLPRLHSANTREAAVVRQLMKSRAAVGPGLMVRDVVKTDELERMIQRGAEVADAA